MDWPSLYISYKWKSHPLWSLVSGFFFSWLFSNFIHIVVWIVTSMAEQYCIVWLIPLLFIHWCIDGHLGYFYLVAVVNCVAMNIYIPVFLEYLFWILWSRSRVAGSYGSLIFIEEPLPLLFIDFHRLRRLERTQKWSRTFLRFWMSHTCKTKTTITTTPTLQSNTDLCQE